MKKLIITSLYVLLSNSLYLNLFAQSTYKYKVVSVSEDVYLLKPIISDFRWVTSNIVVIVNDTDVMVIDSGLLPEAGAEAIKEIQRITPKPIKYLVNTHWHGDHWQGNGAFKKVFPNIDIISSLEGYNGILRNGMAWVGNFYGRYYQQIVASYEDAIQTKSLNGKSLSDDSLSMLIEEVRHAKLDISGIKALKPEFPNLTFSDKMVLRSGARVIELHYLGWGNTTGDVIVYLPSEKILITGDLVVYPSPYESGAFSKEWLDTSLKLREFRFDYLIPGHGDIQTSPQYLDYLNSLFSEIILQVNCAYTNGKNTLEEFQQAVTHKSIYDSLVNKYPEYENYLKHLDPSFVPAAVKSAFQKSKESKL